MKVNKTQILWAVISSFNYIHEYSIAPTRKASQSAFLEGNEGIYKNWKEARGIGFRCSKVQFNCIEVKQ